MGCPQSQQGALVCWHWCLYCFLIVCILRVLGRLVIRRVLRRLAGYSLGCTRAFLCLCCFLVIRLRLSI